VSSSVTTAGGGAVQIACIAEVIVGTPVGGQGSKAVGVDWLPASAKVILMMNCSI
jgi:hypothetical protein